MDENGECVQEHDLNEIMACEELTDSQMNQLKGVLSEYLTAEYLAACLNLQIYQYLVDNEKKLCFKMGTPTGNPGGYQPSSATIYFNITSNITETVFGEEFFHVYQDLYYGGLPTNLGRSNIEFEAKLYHDISHNGFCCTAFWDPAIQDEYLNWITSITNWHQKMPSWNDMLGKYYYFLEKFTELKPEYDYPIDYSLKPDAILNLNDCL